MSAPTLRSVIDKYRNLIGEQVASEMEADLLAREDEVADTLRQMGTQLGTYPEFVALALVDAGLGTPPTEEMHTYLRQQFMARVEAHNEQIRRLRGEG